VSLVVPALLLFLAFYEECTSPLNFILKVNRSLASLWTEVQRSFHAALADLTETYETWQEWEAAKAEAADFEARAVYRSSRRMVKKVVHAAEKSV